MGKSVTHTLDTIDTLWDAVMRGEKRFEVRKDDRFFQSGDVVILRKIDETTNYVSPPGDRFGFLDLSFRIGWILRGGQYGLKPAYVAFQLEDLPATPQPESAT